MIGKTKKRKVVMGGRRTIACTNGIILEQADRNAIDKPQKREAYVVRIVGDDPLIFPIRPGDEKLFRAK